MEQRKLDDAIVEQLQESHPDFFVTGWILVTAIQSPNAMNSGDDNYVILTSEGMPYHSQIGLLKVAQDDKQNVSMLASLTSFMFDDEGEYEEGEE